VVTCALGASGDFLNLVRGSPVFSQRSSGPPEFDAQLAQPTDCLPEAPYFIVEVDAVVVHCVLKPDEIYSFRR
jgi:hypothetical protein